MGAPHEELLEHVRCALCGADDGETVYEARYDRQKDFDLVQKFRASGDELLIDRLVKCRQCGLRVRQPAAARRSHPDQLHRG